MATCPTPRKVAHETEEDARRHARALHRHKDAAVDLQPYRCVCGKWHVGHGKQRLSDRIRTSIRRSPKMPGARRKRH